MSKYKVEALLFVSKKPVTANKISEVIGCNVSTVERWLSELEREYSNRGINIRRVAGGYEMVTAAECVDAVQPFVRKDYQFLSKPALETVSIICVNQPVKRSKIARFRNVKNPDSGLDALLDLKLIKDTEDGYVTTDQFLTYFGINDLNELKEKLEQFD